MFCVLCCGRVCALCWCFVLCVVLFVELKFVLVAGVGGAAVQLARHFANGASNVIAVSSSDDKAKYAKSIGATSVIMLFLLFFWIERLILP
jgi:Zn-dependent alcohol dehydrogenase